MGKKKKEKENKRSKGLMGRIARLPEWKKKQRSNIKKYPPVI